MTASKTLLLAKELLEKPGVHTTGREMRDKEGNACNLNKAVQFGISGALMKVSDSLPYDPHRITNCLRSIYSVLQSVGFKSSIHNFNDNYKLSDILQVLQMASDASKKDGN